MNDQRPFARALDRLKGVGLRPTRQRLALARGEAKPAGGKDGKNACIVPTKALSQLQKLLAGSDEPVQIAVTENQVFFNIGGAALENQSFKIWDTKSVTYPPETTAGGIITRPAQRIEGFRLVDSRASYGIGLETFALGFPVHFDWSYRTLFNEAYENYLFGPGGSAAFRKMKFAVWIGYDF